MQIDAVSAIAAWLTRTFIHGTISLSNILCGLAPGFTGIELDFNDGRNSLCG